MDTSVVLPADTNQALGLGHYAVEFMNGEGALRGDPDRGVVERTNLFFTDAVICGVSALALGTNAPTLLRREALEYAAAPRGWGTRETGGATVFGSCVAVQVEKAIAANAAAVREWDSNGTNFGYNPALGHTAGEFGHNDYYAVAIAAAQAAGRDGAYAMRGMVLLDEIRGRLAEVFSLKTYKIDHVLHGAIASAAVYGAMLGATPEQIESAIGMVVAHHVPFRAIRAGKQLSDSKGASAAISTEAAVTCMRRSMRGFLGPRDIFRNPEAVFCLFEGKARGDAEVKAGKRSPFDLVLARAGSDFAVMGMHFKLGLYEHQSAGALQGLIDLLATHPRLLDDQSGDCVSRIVVKAYEPAFGIIGDPAKRDPRTRQSADHSMVYLVCTMLRKALELRAAGMKKALGWKELMLTPQDFSPGAIADPLTRSLMEKMSFEHGGAEYDARYPDGIPTSVVITDDEGNERDSGLVMYPAGHARNTVADLKGILAHKFEVLGRLAFEDPGPVVSRLSKIEKKSAAEIAGLHGFEIASRERLE